MPISESTLRLLEQDREKARQYDRANSTPAASRTTNLSSNIEQLMAQDRVTARQYDRNNQTITPTYRTNMLKSAADIGGVSKEQFSAAKTPLLSGYDERADDYDGLFGALRGVGESALAGIRSANEALAGWLADVTPDAVKENISLVDVDADAARAAASAASGAVQERFGRTEESREQGRERQQQATDYLTHRRDELDTGADVDRLFQEAANSQEEAARIREYTVGDSGAFAQLLFDAGVGGVQMGYDALMNFLIPGSGLASAGLRGAGSGILEAQQSGANTLQQLAYGLGVGAVEAATEKISNLAAPLRRVFGGGVADRAVSSLVNRLTSSTAGRALLNLAASAAGEGFEEFVSSAANPVLRRIFDENALAEYGDPQMWADAAYDALVGATIGGVLGGAGQVIENRANRRASQNAAEAPTAGTATQTGVDTSTGVNPVEAGIDASVRLFNEGGGVMDAQTPNNTASEDGSLISANENQQETTSDGRASQTDTVDTVSSPAGNSSISPAGANVNALADSMTDEQLALEQQRIRDQYAALNQPAAQTSQNGEVSATDSLGAAPRGYSVGHAPEIVENQRHAVENVVSPENLNPAQTHERLSRQDRQFYSQQRLGVDLEGEMADLQTKQNWNAVDAQTAFDILRMVDQRARQTGSAEDIAEVAKWQALVDRKGSSAGQTLQVYADEARKAGDPAVIAADAANIFAAEEAKQGRNSQDNKAINTVSRGVNRAIRDARSAISGAFNEASSGKRPAKHSGIVQQVEGQLSLDLGRAEVSRSPEQIQRDIRAALRDIGTTINQVAKADRSNDANLQTQISNVLQTKYGFTPDEATNVGEIVGNYFNQMVVEESNRILANTFKTREPSVQRTFEERLNEMMNLGAFSNENYAQLASDALFGGSLDLKDQRHKEALAEIYNYAQRLSDIPEGDTDSTIQLIKELSDRRRTNGLIGGALGERLSAGHDLALEKMAQQPGGAQFLHDLALSQIRQIANDYKSRSASDYVFGVRYLNMLSGLNTVARNLIGNPAFSLTETGANNLGVLFDTLLARKTGMRTLATDRTMFSRAALNGASDAFLRSYLEVAFDADVSNVQSRYGQGGSRTFRMSGNPLERFFSTWEKWNRYMLTTTDEVSKGAARGEITRGLQELQNRGADVSDEFIENRANQVALERTFQNDSAVAQGMRQIQSGLDKMTGGVLGRTAIPFAKIGGNVGTQFANYSPASLVSDTVRLIRTLRDTNRGAVTPEQQANTAMSLGRTITGGALISIFTALALKGILTVASDDDEKDLDRTEGLNGTQLNLSAAWRWLNGESTEYQDGDELLSIGFLEPINGFMSMGSMIADDIESDPDADFWSRVGSIGNATAAGLFQSISELPAMSGLQTIQDAIEYADGDSVGEQVANAAISYIGSQLPSFVVPNFLTNIAEGTDPYVRAPWEADSLGEELLYQVMADIPGLRQNVPVRQDIWGQDMTYTDSDAMNFINQTISPGAITTYHTNWANQEARRLGNLPPDVPDSFSVDGETVQLNQAQQREYSRVRGSTALEIINELERNPIYADMSLEEQNALWDKIYDYAGDIAKRSIDSRYELDGANASAENYGDPAEYFLYNEAWKAVEDSKGANTAAFEAVMQDYERMSTQKQNALIEALGEGTRFDDVVDAYEAGIDPERWYEAYDKHQELNENENLSANSAATEFAKWLDTESGFNANQRDVIEEQMRFWNMFPADTERYDALIDAGFTPEKADAVYDAVSALQPQQGKTQVSDLQRYEAIANMSGLTDAEKVQALTEYEGASSGDRQKFSTAYAYGISPELYVNMLEMQDEGVGDEDGNGRYKQDEAKLLIDTLMDSNSDMTTREAAILWAMLCPTSKTGNPYGNIYGSTSMEWDYAP